MESDGSADVSSETSVVVDMVLVDELMRSLSQERRASAVLFAMNEEPDTSESAAEAAAADDDDASWPLSP